jgi:hypothetical protein
VRKVICGSRPNPAETWFFIGIPLERPAASKNSFPLILKARANAMVTGYSAYDRFAGLRAQEEQPLTLAGCFAHVRRVAIVPLAAVESPKEEAIRATSY